MHLLEVALQGIRGFSPSLRLPLSPGHTVVRPPGADVAPLGGFLAAVLHADGRGAEAGFSAQKDKPGRVALTLVGNDGHTYRLVRELGGKSALQRVGRGPQGMQATMETLAQDAPGILQVLRGPAGLPGKTAYEELFLLHGAQRPSVRAREKVRAVAAAAGTPAHGAPAGAAPSLGLGVNLPVTAARDVLAARSRLTELEAELVMAREVAQLQYDADGVEADLFQLASRIKGLDAPREALQAAQAALAKAPTPASLGLPDDILARVQRYPTAVRRRDEQLARLNAEKGKAQAEPALPRVDPLVKDRHLLASAGVGLLLLVAGALLTGAFRYLALLGIPTFGYAAMRALRFVDHLQQVERRSRRENVTAVREKKVHEEYEADAGPVDRAMDRLQVETPEEVAAALAEYARLSDEVKRRSVELAAAESSPERQATLARHRELQARAAQLNAELERKGGGVRDVRDVERELTRVRDSIALAEGGTASDPMAALHEPLQDPCPGLVTLAGDLLGKDAPTVVGLVRDRFQQYFAALTDKRYGVVEFAPTGKATVQVGTNKLPASQLPPRDMDLLYLSLRLTLVEKLSAHRKVPLVVEDAFGSLDEAKFPLVARMLKHLGTLTQVVQVAVHPAFASDPVVML